MCGFAGILGIEPPGSIGRRAARMADTLAHRGPDGVGLWADEEAGVALAHRRLAVIDVSQAGSQPMASSCGQWVIAFNGEIYNHRELRTRLTAQGHGPAWRGHADTEVLLEAIAAWGPEQAIAQAVGMFAVAVWNRSTHRLVLARDRMGEKPLYLGRAGRALVFGSGLQAIRAHPGFDARTDPRAMTEYLRYGYVPAPRSIHLNAAKLPPGCLLEVGLDARGGVDLARSRLTRYWSLGRVAHDGARAPFQGSPSDAVDELERLLTRAVAAQRVADRPVGAFLSGGVDSSVVSAIARRVSAQPLRTYSIGFADPRYDETTFARQVARQLGSVHSEAVLGERDAHRLIGDLGWVYDEPFADSSQLPSMLLASWARRDVVVALTGDGGDELFAGYTRHWHGARIERWRRRPRWIRHAAAGLLQGVPAAGWDRARETLGPRHPALFEHAHFGDKLHKLATVLREPGLPTERALVAINLDPLSLLAPRLRETEQTTGMADLLIASFDANDTVPPPAGFTERAMLEDGLGYLPDDLLVKVDRAAMAYGLETRLPLLDHRVVEFAWRLPPQMRCLDGRGKWPLRALCDRLLPGGLATRPKTGFAVPLGDWLRGPWREWAEASLDASRLKTQDFFEARAVRALWERHSRSGGTAHHALWAVLAFNAWWDASGEATRRRPADASERRVPSV